MEKLKKTKGFTLLEVLLVVSIMGFLIAAAMYQFTFSRMKARDAKRMVDLSQMKKALDIFYDENGRYPSEAAPDNANTGNTGKICSTCTGEINTFLKKYIKSLPSDPLDDGTGNTGGDLYYYYYDGAHNCGGNSNSPISIIFAHRMETNIDYLDICSTYGSEGDAAYSSAYHIIVGE